MNTGLPVIHPDVAVALLNNQLVLNELYHLKGRNSGATYPVYKEGQELAVPKLGYHFSWIKASVVWQVEHAMIRECGELLESAATLSNWFKPKERTNYDNCIMELADLLFFTLTGELKNLGFVGKAATMDRGLDGPVEDESVNELWEYFTAEFTKLLAEPTLDQWCVVTYCALCALARKDNNFTLMEELDDNPAKALNRVIEVYWMKSHINKMRVSCGLFEPEGYDKTHFGVEDNRELEVRLAQKVGSNFSYWNYVSGMLGHVVILEVVREQVGNMEHEYTLQKVEAMADDINSALDSQAEEVAEEEGELDEEE